MKARPGDSQTRVKWSTWFLFFATVELIGAVLTHWRLDACIQQFNLQIKHEAGQVRRIENVAEQLEAVDVELRRGR